MALIYVYRASAFSLSAESWTLKIDDEEVAAMGNGTYVAYETRRPNVTISVNSRFTLLTPGVYAPKPVPRSSM